MLLGSLLPRRPQETASTEYAEAVVDTLLQGIAAGAR
jgi:hypothetical protein